MIAARHPVRRLAAAKILAIDAAGHVRHAARQAFVDFLRTGDLVVANDAATLPASLTGRHVPSGGAIEVRLASWNARDAGDVTHFSAVVFGAGDYHTPTEHRPPPPALATGDRLSLGPLAATITEILGHPRFIALQFEGSHDQIWAGIADHGRPIQYAHVTEPLALWDVWTAVAGHPTAFEPPSAGFVLDWRTLAGLHARGVGFASITLAAGISSTGDDELDRRLPLDEPYDIPARTAEAITATRARGGRVIAIGTTVVRALEHAIAGDGIVRAGRGLATRRIDPANPPRLVDAILSGVHPPGTSHYDLLRAFAGDKTLDRANQELVAHGYRAHEFGDAMFIERLTARSVMPAPSTRADATLQSSFATHQI